jgi:glutamate-ammonia-ligase adenylyltransferase
MLNFSGIPPELHLAAQRFWEQCEANINSQNLTHPSSALPAAIAPEVFGQQLTRAFVGSEFIAKTCAVHPQYLVEQVASGALFTPWDDNFFEGVTAAINACNQDAELDSCLRQYRQRAMVRLVWRDLNRLDSMQKITAELSRFADKTIALAADYHYRALEKLHGGGHG